MKNKDNVRRLKVADISDAVELLVAASEALLIHELVESESTTKSLSPSAIVDVALRVKQARMEDFKNSLNLAHDESSDSDCLSDMDDSTMEDAYKEVGLSVSAVTQCDCDSISLVKDTYATKNCGSVGKCIYKGHETLGFDSADISTKQKLSESKSYCIQSKAHLVLESFDNGSRKKHISLAQGLETSREVGVDSILNYAIQENTDISSTYKV